MRHSHYQTDQYVSVDVFDKSICEENTSVEISHDKVSVTVDNGGEENFLSFDLYQAIITKDSTYKIVKNTKVNIKLIKAVAGKWPALTREVEKDDGSGMPAKKEKNWDKVIKESGVDEEKPEGDQALNELFQKIYKDADPNTKRAMNKSYMESGGTVLSTNWSEVGSKTVEVKPPEGMEYKTYDA